MAAFRRAKNDRGGPFTFRVSDVIDVPLRGLMLRLRLVDGTPSMTDLGVGSLLRLRSPAGVERDVRVAAHAVTGGKPTQERLDRVRELDVVIEDGASREPIEIGWIARGPVA
jgi:hypothetical protein